MYPTSFSISHLNVEFAYIPNVIIRCPRMCWQVGSTVPSASALFFASFSASFSLHTTLSASLHARGAFLLTFASLMGFRKYCCFSHGSQRLDKAELCLEFLCHAKTQKNKFINTCTSRMLVICWATLGRNTPIFCRLEILTKMWRKETIR